MARAKKIRTGRPSLPADQRKGSSYAFRMLPEMRAALEGAAKKAGRSLSEEIQARLDRSFQENAARGGSEISALFDLMAGAAKLIQARTGKTLSDDPKTFIAVRSAWHRLIMSLAPSVESYREYFDSIGLSDLASELPPRPTPPNRPEGAEMGLLGPRLSPQQETEFAEKWAAYEKAIKQHDAIMDEDRRKWQTFAQHRLEIEEMGKDVALDLLPRKPKD